MQWIEPKYTRKQVEKAGKKIIKSEFTSSEFKDSFPIFYNWRTCHAFPMQIMLDLLRKNALRVDKQALVVQRLKRSSSIFWKLIREEGMSLSRMEDIAGCRAVLNDAERVRKLFLNLKNSKTKHILHRERDYISYPKKSGYRGIHLVYRYNGGKEKYHGLYVELQLRSKIQHSWATAVEVVGNFTSQALKASSGDEDWLDYFKYASVEFAKLEGCPIDESYSGIDTLKKLQEFDKALNVEKKLRAFNVAVKTITERKSEDAHYFLLLLDLSKRVINLRAFKKTELEKATQLYNDDEQKYSTDNTKNLVLVSAGSVKELKNAYPNYFSDTEHFSKYIEMVFSGNR